MPKGYVLSEGDKELLKQVVEAYLGRVLGSTNRPDALQDQGGAPEVYVAMTPEGGIPALTISGGGTGTSSATANEEAEAVAGYEVCDIYRANREDGRMILIPTKTERVYNASATEVPGETWIVILRDKFGIWWATSLGSGGGGSGCVGTLRFITKLCRVDPADTGTGTA
jgi:hypothetical protein